MAKRDVIYGYQTCIECNEDYDLFELHSGSITISTTVCPHCLALNDVRITVVKKQEEQYESN